MPRQSRLAGCENAVAPVPLDKRIVEAEWESRRNLSFAVGENRGKTRVQPLVLGKSCFIAVTLSQIRYCRSYLKCNVVVVIHAAFPYVALRC
jgi:hypothetical protein